MMEPNEMGTPINSWMDWLYAPTQYETTQSLLDPNFTYPVALPPPRVITYSIHSEAGGRYNGTFLWGRLTEFLNEFARYWNIVFSRANAGRIRIIQGTKYANTTIAAWQSGFDLRISPTYNFASQPTYQAYICMKVICHEFMHCLRSTHLTTVDDLMHTNGSMALGNFGQNDARYYMDTAYAQTLNPRPWTERDALRRKYIPNFQSTAMMAYEPQIEIKCDHKRDWKERMFGRRLPAIREAP